MAVVRGDAAAYVHSGGRHEWDAAALVAVARHFGLYVPHLDGKPLRFNQHDTVQRDLLVCHPELASAFLTAAFDRGAPRETVDVPSARLTRWSAWLLAVASRANCDEDQDGDQAPVGLVARSKPLACSGVGPGQTAVAQSRGSGGYS
jgi:hypothetical protein